MGKKQRQESGEHSGWICDADSAWVTFLRNHRDREYLIYAKSADGAPAKLQPGALFACCMGKEATRHIHVVGRYVDHSEMSRREAWNKYSGGIAAPDFASWSRMAGSDSDTVACYRLTPYTVLDAPLAFDRCGLEVSVFALQKGQYLNESQVDGILSHISPAI